MSPYSAKTYRLRLERFAEYLDKEGLDLDSAIAKLRARELDPYSILSGLAAFMAAKSPRYQAHVVKTTKNFLEFNDVEISQTKFKLKVKMRKVIRADKLGLSKDDVREIIRTCSGDVRLETYVMFLAATGARATESLHVKLKDLHLKDNPPFVFIHGENTKTKADRKIYLTTELIAQLRKWITEKYRERRTKYDHNTKSISYERFKPEPSDNDYLFMPFHHEGEKLPGIPSLYVTLDTSFAKRLDRMGRGEKEDGKNRRKITFHSFRRFVKSTISDLGYQDYSEWFIGHEGSTYYRKPEKEKAELFRKIEPYLTFMDFAQLEARGADIQTQLNQERDQRLTLQEQMQIIRGRMEQTEKGYEELRETTNRMLTGLATELSRKGASKDEILDAMTAALGGSWTTELDEQGKKAVEEYRAKKAAQKV